MEQPPRSPSPASDSDQSDSTSSSEEIQTSSKVNQRRRSIPSPYDFHDNEPMTLVEVRMRFFSGNIRTKPAWWEKIHDDEVVAKWRAEITKRDKREVEKLWGGNKYWMVWYGKSAGKLQGTPKRWPREPITEAQLDYIIEEIKYEATQRDEKTGIFQSSIPGVYESPSLIAPEISAEFIKAVSILEDVPEAEKDWRPESNNQVLDLVHPSLYCLRIGESLVRLSDTSGSEGSPEVLTNDVYIACREDLSVVEEYTLSAKYQWLPTDFVVSEDGDEATPSSYINNIHPIRHQALYPPISSIVARFVPLFEKVLAHAVAPTCPLIIQVDPWKWYDHVTAPEPYYKDVPKRKEWTRLHRWAHIPDPSPFQPPQPVQPFPLTGRTLQVIVKLSNIVLTPENPSYPGGTWYVEGMANERIVATGIYYYNTENITESRLSFRQCVSEGDWGMSLEYEQNDSRGYCVAYGFGNGDSLSQRLGYVVAKEGKCIAFPNFHQHWVHPFRLADATKPGVRKILTLFLVDPEIRVLSTSDVPPQQEEWAIEEMGKASGMGKLPVELFEMIADYAKSGLISRETAKEHRVEVMEERSQFVRMNNEEVFDMEFTMH